MRKKLLLLLIIQLTLISCIKRSYYYSDSDDELVGDLNIPIFITQTYDSNVVDYIMINKYINADSFLEDVEIVDGDTQKKFERSYREDIDFYYFKIPKSYPKKINIKFKYLSNNSSKPVEMKNLELKKKKWISTSFH